MDPRLEKINKTWTELTEQASRLSRAGAQLAELERQRNERQQRVAETGAIYRKEQDDVDKLEQGGLRAFFIGLTGNMEERLTKERREAMAAKYQYDQAMSDLEYLDGKIRELRGQQEELKQVQQRLEALSQAKAKLLKELGGETGEQLLEMDRRQAELEHQLREVREALFAGRRAETAIEQVVNSLDSAEGWGMWDMLGGGLLSTAIKHGHMDDAQDGLRQVQRALSDFRTELADVGNIQIPDISIGSFATFADYFFDGIFVDWYVQSNIHDAQRGVSEVQGKVQAAVHTLEAAEDSLDLELEGLKARRSALLDSVQS
ncbi:hypothetical protein [Intestinimonas massiliensis (ex Afouda et al. 2020)]|uniref:hypothetical protein n=1 Tax=Intestinimonas massiliensis (ex Afouda et al. 2020) TaxID=1673721 RepID=UPI0013EF04CE|nr:hypothetical protein [Intestinimonas massiliensis (ex Afouda et al. 2020)]